MAKTASKKSEPKIEAEVVPEQDNTALLFETAEIEQDKIEVLSDKETVTENPVIVKIPNFHDPAWSDFVLTQFTEDELIDGHPNCDGLRRVFAAWIGIPKNVIIDVLQVPIPQQQNRATVKCSIEYYPYTRTETGQISGQTLPTTFIVSDVADCFEGNTKFPYHIYPTATAATMAEGRALRKALRVKVITVEEAQSPDAAISKEAIAQSADANPINDMQRNAIHRISKNLGINVNKLLVHLAKEVNSKSNVENLNSTEAQAVLRQLTGFDRGPDNGGVKVPDELFGS